MRIVNTSKEFICPIRGNWTGRVFSGIILTTHLRTKDVYAVSLLHNQMDGDKCAPPPSVGPVIRVSQCGHLLNYSKRQSL